MYLVDDDAVEERRALLLVVRLRDVEQRHLGRRVERAADDVSAEQQLLAKLVVFDARAELTLQNSAASVSSAVTSSRVVYKNCILISHLVNS